MNGGGQAQRALWHSRNKAPKLSVEEKVRLHLKQMIAESLHNLNDDVSALQSMGVKVGFTVDDKQYLYIQFTGPDAQSR